MGWPGSPGCSGSHSWENLDSLGSINTLGDSQDTWRVDQGWVGGSLWAPGALALLVLQAGQQKASWWWLGASLASLAEVSGWTLPLSGGTEPMQRQVLRRPSWSYSRAGNRDSAGMYWNQKPPISTLLVILVLLPIRFVSPLGDKQRIISACLSEHSQLMEDRKFRGRHASTLTLFVLPLLLLCEVCSSAEVKTLKWQTFRGSQLDAALQYSKNAAPYHFSIPALHQESSEWVRKVLIQCCGSIGYFA